MARTNGRTGIAKGWFIAGAAATLVVAGTVRAQEASPDPTKPGGARATEVRAARAYDGTGSAAADVEQCRCGPGMAAPGSVVDPARPSVAPAPERSGDRARQSDIDDARGVADGNSGGRG
jgi:hypothetical protein